MTDFGAPGQTTAPHELPALRRALLEWFDASGRELPWRAGPEGGRDPYRVWVAEILLQQTQVARGLGYYERFLDAFPDVHALAAAPEAEVLKAWEGCGYYARARNLRRAAQIVAAQGFPGSSEGWLALPGVGPYTAAAISSLAHGEAKAVNDGNVRRVLSRLSAQPAPTERWVQARADALLDPARPGAWNEALMDLGATVCTPRAPRCGLCPLAAFCAARASGDPAAYPAPKVRAAVQERRAVALLIGDAQEAVLERRTGRLLGGLMGLPAEEVGAGESPRQALERLCARLHVQAGPLLGQVVHTMTHRRIVLEVVRGHALPAARLSAQPVAKAALSRLDQKALALVAQRQDSLFVL
ncbi:A/G-specific adenine glycosylase [Deinococcus koreensis]|uniref:Adenine DNA glycosylase n=1 Tax=Deinococcus koreensis TaxID=2054903 RepID=A0A2K3UYN4_9DEIO|nr:A/G-specific adenine glycosylase [Deinococcus koreensis]PNY81643.1 A/G-specific adenine glycosylase [Deinococcus koreensis]